MTNPYANFDLSTLDGQSLNADELATSTVLFVNVASRCGLTPQYKDLVALHKQSADTTLRIVGVPCNQFGRQEPGTAEEILQFCASSYGVDFPLLTKRDVNGDNRAPLYTWMVESEAGGGEDIAWNFGKFLVHNGVVTHRFEPATSPRDPKLTEAIASLTSS